MSSNIWNNLDAISGSILGRRVDADHPREWFWCVDPEGRYGLALYGLSNQQLPSDISEFAGMKVSMRAKSDGKQFVLLTLANTADWEMFRALCDDLIESTRASADPDQALTLAVGRLRRWQRFLSRGRRPKLTEEEARGLLGELMLLSQELKPRFGVVAAIAGWRGLDDHPQDFAVAGRAFEVKSRLSSARQSVEISSADQLECDLPLVLVVQDLTPTPASVPGSTTLDELVGVIRDAARNEDVGSAERFSALLEDYGYEESREYSTARYADAGRRYFKVSEGFPRIIRSQTPSTISRVRYALDLTQLADYQTRDTWS